MERTNLAAPSVSVGVTKSSVEDLDTNLTGLRWSYLHIFDNQRFVRLISHRSYGIGVKKRSNQKITIGDRVFKHHEKSCI